jgi:hypothetical protein
MGDINISIAKYSLHFKLLAASNQIRPCGQHSRAWRLGDPGFLVGGRSGPGAHPIRRSPLSPVTSPVSAPSSIAGSLSGSSVHLLFFLLCGGSLPRWCSWRDCLIWTFSQVFVFKNW